MDKKVVVPSFTDEEKLLIKESFFHDNLMLLKVINSDKKKLEKFNYL